MLGDKIKQRLNALGLSQKDLAFKLNLSPSTLNGYITGYRTPDILTLKRIAEELRVPSSYFLDDSDEINETNEDYSIFSETNFNVLGSRIKELRKQYGFSQLEFAKKLNVSNTTLSMYEAGKRIPSDEIMHKIADCFNVTIDYLLGRTSDKQNDKILGSVEADTDLLEFVQAQLQRESMKLLITQLGTKSDAEIAKIMRYIKFIEEEANH
ncbi:MAG: helix-turn-helix domain-containing protein [Cellulosilyticaceae bacterium]